MNVANMSGHEADADGTNTARVQRNMRRAGDVESSSAPAHGGESSGKRGIVRQRISAARRGSKWKA